VSNTPERNWRHVYAPSFEQHRKQFGFGGANFEFFISQLKDYLDRHPWFYSEEVPSSAGIRMVSTLEVLEDLPPLYVYFEVDQTEGRSDIRYLGFSPNWSEMTYAPAA
jgi:hypothetical protein